MRTIPEHEAKQLDSDLLSATQQLREHAANHLYRQEACKAVGERILADYHGRQAALVHAQADGLRRWRQFLAQRTSPVPGAAVRPRDIPVQTGRGGDAAPGPSGPATVRLPAREGQEQAPRGPRG
jgi:DNA-binding transcriptional MocR family regulator